MDRRPRRGRYHGDALRESGQRLLVGLIEKPLFIKLLLQLLKGQRQISRPLRGHGVAVKLIRAVPGKDADPARHQHLHAVFRTKPQTQSLSLEHDAPDGSGGVLQGKIVVPRGVHFIVGDLTADADAGQHGLVVQQELHQLVDLCDAENMPLHSYSLSSQGRSRADTASSAHRENALTRNKRNKPARRTSAREQTR